MTTYFEAQGHPHPGRKLQYIAWERATALSGSAARTSLEKHSLGCQISRTARTRSLPTNTTAGPVLPATPHSLLYQPDLAKQLPAITYTIFSPAPL